MTGERLVGYRGEVWFTRKLEREVGVDVGGKR